MDQKGMTSWQKSMRTSSFRYGGGKVGDTVKAGGAEKITLAAGLHCFALFFFF